MGPPLIVVADSFTLVSPELHIGRALGTEARLLKRCDRLEVNFSSVEYSTNESAERKARQLSRTTKLLERRRGKVRHFFNVLHTEHPSKTKANGQSFSPPRSDDVTGSAIRGSKKNGGPLPAH